MVVIKCLMSGCMRSSGHGSDDVSPMHEAASMAPPLTVRFFLLAWLAAVVTAQDAVVAVPLDDAPTCGWAQFLVTNTEAILGNELVSYTCTPCSLCTPGTRQTG
jgi:hypothetical protein